MDTLLYFVLADYITGLIVAVRTRTLSSSLGWSGITKKLMMFLIVALVEIVDLHLLHMDGSLYSATVLFYVANEGISILENACNIGLTVPSIIKNVFEHVAETHISESRIIEKYHPKHAASAYDGDHQYE